MEKMAELRGFLAGNSTLPCDECHVMGNFTNSRQPCFRVTARGRPDYRLAHGA